MGSEAGAGPGSLGGNRVVYEVLVSLTKPKPAGAGASLSASARTSRGSAGSRAGASRRRCRAGAVTAIPRAALLLPPGFFSFGDLRTAGPFDSSCANAL